MVWAKRKVGVLTDPELIRVLAKESSNGYPKRENASARKEHN